MATKVSLEKFIVNSKLTGHCAIFGFDDSGRCLIKVKLKYENYIFKKIILAQDYIQNPKMPHSYQIKENIYKKDFIKNKI
jgi:hypothetical protein